MAELTGVLRADGHDIRRLDLGGGLGIPYRRGRTRRRRLPFDYGEVVRRTVGHLGCEIEIEPGRLIAGNAGRAAGAGDLPQAGRGAGLPDPRRGDERPDPAGDVRRLARHRAGASSRRRGRRLAPIDVVGPVCETGDTFARGRALPPLGAGDLVAFRSAGAYGAVMASEYNSRPLVPEVLVAGDHFAVVRARPSFDEMLEARYHPGLDRAERADSRPGGRPWRERQSG